MHIERQEAIYVALFALLRRRAAHLFSRGRPCRRTDDRYDGMIARYAKAHGVPEAFVHRMIMRESHYNPRIVHKNCYGLLQIKPATARSMGFGGDPRGLLDPETNLTYAVPYLANAYGIAGGNEARAATLFSSGYYATAKRQKMLGALQTASTLAPARQQTAKSTP